MVKQLKNLIKVYLENGLRGGKNGKRGEKEGLDRK